MGKTSFSVGIITDIGNVKATNQDNLLVRIGEDRLGEFGLFLVADGMGGLAHGAIASQIVVERFNAWWESELLTILELNKKESIKALDSVLTGLVQDSNCKILNFSKQVGLKVGTTISMLFVYHGKYFVRHVGDSRIYLINKKLQQLTLDHSWVGREVREGRLTPDQAKGHPKKNVLLQCLGINEKIEVYEASGDTNSLDSFLICSDGFHNYLKSREVYDAVQSYKSGDCESLQEIAASLLEKVKDRGARDNVSQILVCQDRDSEKSTFARMLGV